MRGSRRGRESGTDRQREEEKERRKLLVAAAAAAFVHAPIRVLQVGTNVAESLSFFLSLSFSPRSPLALPLSVYLSVSPSLTLSRRRGQILHRRINIGGRAPRLHQALTRTFLFSLVAFGRLLLLYNEGRDSRRRAAAFLSRGSLSTPRAVPRETIVKSVLRSWPRTWR